MIGAWVVVARGFLLTFTPGVFRPALFPPSAPAFFSSWGGR